MAHAAHADAWFHPETTHLVCEDYAAVSPPGSGWTAAIVCDGCSGSADTDVGARVLAWAALTTLAGGRLVDPGTAAWHASVVARPLALPVEALDATLLAALVTDDGVRVVAAGDGVIGARHRDGRYELWQLEHPDGAPPYPSYVLDPHRRRDYLLTFGDRLAVRHRAPDGVWSTSTAPGGQLFARSLSDRNGFGPTDAHAVVGSMRDAVAAVHRAGVLAVDLSDVNVLVDPVDRRPSFIDTDSWQTPDHPATAVTPAIRDPRTTSLGFSEASDWFSFAVLSFQLWIGIHPFRGKHPQVKGLADRMAAGLSVLDPDVSVPSACRPMSVIPAAYRAWFSALFVDARREPPPPSVHAAAGFVLPPIRPAPAPAPSSLTLQPRGETTGVIRQVVPGDADVDLWLVTDAGVERGVGDPVVHGPVDLRAGAALGRDPDSGAWLLATIDPDARFDGSAWSGIRARSAHDPRMTRA